MSHNPGRSRQAQIASFVRKARAAEDAGRIPEAVSLLREVVQLDPNDPGTLHRLGDLFRLRLNRLREAARWYARAARAQERDDLPVRAIAEWRIVLQCDRLHVEAHERLGVLYVEAGRVADARLHYERSEGVLREAGLGREATILRAQREALEEVPGEPIDAPEAANAPPPASRAASFDLADDAEASGLAADRLANGRVYHHFGLHAEARRQLEELLTVLPEHVEARQLLAEVCQALGDRDAAARHLDVLVQLMRSRGEAPAPAAGDAPGLPPVEEWEFEDADHDPFVEVLDEIRDDVERLVDRIEAREGKK